MREVRLAGCAQAGWFWFGNLIGLSAIYVVMRGGEAGQCQLLSDRSAAQ